jgi:hypothetical protein
MGQLASNQLSINSDPALVQRQILQDRERQLQAIQNPQQQLAARLGGLLGGGIANVAQDRGFFDINDPLLSKVTQIQGIYNQVAQQIDPASNPQQFFSALQQAYSDAGLGREALLASQESQKYLKEGLALESSRLDLFNKNPELLDKEIAKATKDEDLEKVASLGALKKRLEDDRNLTRRAKEAQINASEAQAAVAKATAEGKDIVQLKSITGEMIPYERKNGKLVPLVIEGASTTPPPGTGQGKFSQARKGVYNPQTGKVEYK